LARTINIIKLDMSRASRKPGKDDLTS